MPGGSHEGIFGPENRILDCGELEILKKLDGFETMYHRLAP